MKTKLLILSALIFGVIFTVSAKKKETAPVLGVVYKLPRTVVKINVTAEYTQIIAGPYAAYAETYLGIKNVPKRDMQLWQINDVSFNTFAEADPAQQYQSLGNAGSLISLCNNGVIAGINTIAEEQKNELSYSTFVAPKLEKPITNFTNLTMDGRTYTVTDSTGTHIFTKSDEEMAQEAANTIIDLRQQRYDLLSSALSSNEPTNAQALQTAADKINKLEAEYLALFIGESYSGEYNFTFDYVPTNSQNNNEVAFRFSELNGPVPANDLSGAPVIAKTDNATVLQNDFNAAESSSALYYRIPGKTTLNLMYAGKTLATAKLEIAQFGTIMPIPDQLLDGRFEVKINTETGAIMGSKQVVFDIDKKKK